MGIFSGWRKEGKHEVVPAITLAPDEEVLTFAKTVEVADIRQYLMDEYHRCNVLKDENERLKKRIEDLEKVNHKYNATLVTLSEYDRRLKDAERREKNLNDKMSQQGQTIREQKDELNRLKIERRGNANRDNEIRRAACSDILHDLKVVIDNTGGTWSKKKVLGIIDEFLSGFEE